MRFSLVASSTILLHACTGSGQAPTDAANPFDVDAGIDPPSDASPDASADAARDAAPPFRFDPVAGVQSGSRLRAVYRVSPDGASEFVRWHDRVRDEDCAIAKDGAGTPRCLPATHSLSYFTDAACADGVVLEWPTSSDPSCAAPPSIRYAAETSAPCDSALAITRLFTLRAAATPPHVYFRDWATGICHGPDPVDPAFRAFVPDVEIPLTEFVGANVTIDASASRLRRRTLSYDDGATEPLADPEDSSISFRCGVAQAEPGQLVCQPPTLHAGTYHSDLGCDAPVAEDWTHCPVAGFFAGLGWDAATASLTYLSIDAPYSGVLYADEGAGCFAVGFGPDAYYLTGAPIAFAPVPLARELAPNGRRLAPYEYRAADGFSQRAFGPWERRHDTALGIDCAPGALADGSTRCLDAQLSWITTTTFSDAACTVELPLAVDGYRRGNVTFTYATDSCARATRAHRVGAEFFGDYHHRDPSTGACVAYTAGPGSGLYSLGAEVPLADFDALVEITE